MEASGFRQTVYPGASCVIVCFSLDDRKSFNNAKSFWVREAQASAPRGCPMILLGLKLDLREEMLKDENRKGQCVTTEEGKKWQQEFGFKSYIECSAKSRVRLADVFYWATVHSYEPKKPEP